MKEKKNSKKYQNEFARSQIKSMEARESFKTALINFSVRLWDNNQLLDTKCMAKFQWLNNGFYTI